MLFTGWSISEGLLDRTDWIKKRTWLLSTPIFKKSIHSYLSEMIAHICKSDSSIESVNLNRRYFPLHTKWLTRLFTLCDICKWAINWLPADAKTPLATVSVNVLPMLRRRKYHFADKECRNEISFIAHCRREGNAEDPVVTARFYVPAHTGVICPGGHSRLQVPA